MTAAVKKMNKKKSVVIVEDDDGPLKKFVLKSEYDPNMSFISQQFRESKSFGFGAKPSKSSALTTLPEINSPFYAGA